VPPDLRPRRVIASRTTHLSVGAREGKSGLVFSVSTRAVRGTSDSPTQTGEPARIERDTTSAAMRLDDVADPLDEVRLS
jgi:hypothetical protein